MTRKDRLERIAGVLREGRVLIAMGLTIELGQDVVLGARRMVFAMTGTRAAAAPVNLPERVEIHRHGIWAGVPQDLRAQISAAVSWDGAAMLGAGAELWVAMRDGRAMAYAITRRGDRVGIYFFPLTERCSLVSHCLTMPEVRRQGFYTQMLHYIGRTLASEGQMRLYIDCSASNVASQRGIRRAGYAEIGCGRHRRSGATLWWQKAPPSVFRLEAGG